MKNLRAICAEKNVGVCELAHAVGVSHPSVVHWMSGVKSPQANKLPIIARVLGVSIDDLFSDDERGIDNKAG